jgi:hypothetical protein
MIFLSKKGKPKKYFQKDLLVPNPPPFHQPLIMSHYYLCISKKSVFILL